MKTAELIATATNVLGCITQADEAGDHDVALRLISQLESTVDELKQVQRKRLELLATYKGG